MSFISRVLLFLLWLVLSFCGHAWAFSSVNVPLDNWSYAALDKLEGFGLIRSALHGTRPFSRLEMARLIHEAQVEIKFQAVSLPPIVAELLQDLERDFREELALVGKSTDLLQKSFIKPVNEVQMRYVYVQGQPREFLNTFIGPRQYPGSKFWIEATEGTPLVANRDGLIYGEHNNFSLQFSSILGYRDWFSAYVEPFVLTRQNSGGLDNFDYTQLDLLKGYAMVTLWNTQLEAGRDSMWWGQGAHGDNLMTNNAFPLDMLKLSNPEPVLLPWVLRYLGPFKYTLFVSQEVGYVRPSDPLLTGFRLNFKPHPLFEMGFSSALQFGGQGVPSVNWLELFSFLWGKSPSNSNQLAAFDFRWQLPFLRDAQFYMEYAGDDSGGWDPQHPTETVLEDNSWMFGIYFPRLTCDGRSDLRVEYTLNAHRTDESPSLWYGHYTYQLGYTHDGMIMGHHMGPDAEDLFARVSYYLTNNLQVGLDYDRMVRGKTLSVVEERVNQYGADLTVNLCSRDVMLISRYALETVDNYNMQVGSNHRNFLLETVLKLQF